jgi:hypothetical protein
LSAPSERQKLRREPGQRAPTRAPGDFSWLSMNFHTYVCSLPRGYRNDMYQPARTILQAAVDRIPAHAPRHTTHVRSLSSCSSSSMTSLYTLCCRSLGVSEEKDRRSHLRGSPSHVACTGEKGKPLVSTVVANALTCVLLRANQNRLFAAVSVIWA